MPTVARSIGVTAEHIASPKAGFLLDVLIQNLSVNNVYVGSSSGVTTSNGIKLASNAQYSNDKRGEPVYLIADAATSDVRIEYEIYKEGSR